MRRTDGSTRRRERMRRFASSETADQTECENESERVIGDEQHTAAEECTPYLDSSSRVVE